MRRKISILSVITLMPVLVLLALFSLVRPARAEAWVVGGGSCNTIQECIDLASPGDTVVVPAGTYNESVTLDKVVNLEGAGSDSSIIQAVTGQRVMTITGAFIDSSVVISGLALTGGDVSAGNVCYADGSLYTNCGGGMLLTGDADPSLVNLLFEDNLSFRGGGLFVDLGSTPSLNSVAFISNTSLLAGGGAVLRDAATIVGGLYERNKSTQSAGGGLAIATSNSGNPPAFTVTISDTLFISNTAKGSGGAINAFNVNLEIINSRLEENHCLDVNCDGGGLTYFPHAFYRRTVRLTNVDFINNTASRSGGGVSASGVELNFRVDGGRFEGNQAYSGDGGGINARTLSLTGTHFISNTAAGDGGGASVLLTTTVRSAYFERNISQAGDGGGLAVRWNSTSGDLDDSEFVENRAYGDGGGASLRWSSTIMNGGRFAGNRTVTGDGGGLYARDGLTLNSVEFIGNTAGNNGGGAYTRKGEVTVRGGRFEDNQALGSDVFYDGGGGLYADDDGSGPDTSLVVNGTVFINNKAPDGFGGGATVSGPAYLTSVRFQENESGRSGGGLFALLGLMMSDTEFLTNTAVFDGGGALAVLTSTVTGAYFQGNHTDSSGGGLAIRGVLTLSDTAFISNTADVSAGGLRVFPISFDPESSGLTITGSLFQKNYSAGNGGGGVFFGSGFDYRLVVTGTRFLSNTAETRGGGLDYFAYPYSTFHDTIFRGNRAINGQGGGLYTPGTLFPTGKTEFVDNWAGGDGGGAFANSGAVLQGVRFFNNHSLTGDGGGLAMPSGILTMEAGEFISNTAGGDGGAVTANTLTITGGLFEGNSAQGDGGALTAIRTRVISGTYFLRNTAGGDGGGIHMHNFRSSISQVRLVNDLLVENSAGGNGSGIYIAGLNDVTEITHLTIAGAGQSSGQAIYSISGTTSITNTIVASYTVGVEKGNGTLNSHYNVYFDTMTNELNADTSSNNATGNPLFIDPSSGNYRIQPGSSALDSGINAGVFSDIEGAVRPLGADFDRGAYEFPNQAPQVGPISAPVEPVGINVSIEATAPFTDPDTLDTHTGLWNWGDGTDSTGTIVEAGGLGSMTGTHSYTQPDVYTIVLTITDDSGNTGTSVYQFVVVFDPDEGFVTGGGWIESPLGAYRANTSLTGPANYGFVSKYKRGAMMPTGQTQFRFKMGDLNFHSTSYDWLVLNRHSGRAQFKGQGEINGEDGFHFMIWAQDGGLNGNETDTFRIKLWLENADGSETVVYDNGLDRAIAGGSIVIHSGRE